MQAASAQTGGGGAKRPGHDQEKNTPATPDGAPGNDEARPRRVPPDAIPDLMPGVDPQQTPGVDHPPAESD
ncbi:hypothetical protein [Pusillimonas sp.]|uniref:hypothetical protein n=1 Tax=Pusillimonas sp. TaxID=3040095 RepID=UPI0029A50F35|nr:hypothetical protein [Pusillimonas sp.]MDX3893166.1 hypothetical protein [Pusillimonas sp.]